MAMATICPRCTPGDAFFPQFPSHKSSLHKLSAPHFALSSEAFSRDALNHFFARRFSDIGTWHVDRHDHMHFLRDWMESSGLAVWLGHSRRTFHLHFRKRQTTRLMFATAIGAPKEELEELEEPVKKKNVEPVKKKEEVEKEVECPVPELKEAKAYDVEAGLCLLTLAYNYNVLKFDKGSGGYSMGNTTHGGPSSMVQKLLSDKHFQKTVEQALIEAVKECHADTPDLEAGSILPEIKRVLPEFHRDPHKFNELETNDVVKAAIESYEEWIPEFSVFQEEQDRKQEEERKTRRNSGMLIL